MKSFNIAGSFRLAFASLLLCGLLAGGCGKTTSKTTSVAAPEQKAAPLPQLTVSGPAKNIPPATMQAASEDTTTIPALTDARFDELLKSGKPFIVDFWATWCAPCRIMAPTVEGVAKDYSGKIAVYKMDVDKTPETTKRYNVKSIPVLLFFKDKNIVETMEGVFPKDMIVERFNAFIGK
jgi:thioredoxin 1